MKALILTFSIGGAALANAILKLLFQRDRPSLWYSAIVEHSYSFPSGHAMVSSALIVCVLLLVWQTKWRIPATIGGLFLIFMIGLSRLYMGVHYPTDVIAGWSVGILWSLTVYAVVKGISYRLRSRKELVDEKK
jgi:undecaprenyl-diphosphatase